MTASQRLLEVAKQLVEQKVANLELSETVSRLEKTVATKDTTKKVTCRAGGKGVHQSRAGG